jgi:hypothetical protein
MTAMNVATHKPTREDRYKDLICEIADDRDLSKQERNEAIASLLVGYLSLSGAFVIAYGEISFDHRNGVGYPLALFSTQRERGDLLEELGIYHTGSYNAYIAAVIGKLALESVSAIGDPQYDKNF